MNIIGQHFHVETWEGHEIRVSETGEFFFQEGDRQRGRAASLETLKRSMGTTSLLSTPIKGIIFHHSFSQGSHDGEPVSVYGISSNGSVLYEDEQGKKHRTDGRYPYIYALMPRNRRLRLKLCRQHHTASQAILRLQKDWPIINAATLAAAGMTAAKPKIRLK